MDDLDSLRRTYRFLRRQPNAILRGQAYMLWKRGPLGERPTTFVAGPNGVLWRNDRAALLADMKILMLRAGYPIAHVAKFDRNL